MRKLCCMGDVICPRCVHCLAIIAVVRTNGGDPTRCLLGVSASLFPRENETHEITDPTCPRNTHILHHNGATMPTDFLYLHLWRDQRKPIGISRDLPSYPIREDFEKYINRLNPLFGRNACLSEVRTDAHLVLLRYGGAKRRTRKERRMVSSTSVYNMLQHHCSLAKQREWSLLYSSRSVPYLHQMRYALSIAVFTFIVVAGHEFVEARHATKQNMHVHRNT